MQIRQQMINNIESLLLQLATFSRPLRRTRPLTDLLAMLKQQPAESANSRQLFVCYLIAVTQTFHDDLHHKALTIFFLPEQLRKGDDDFALLRPFISLLDANLLTFANTNLFLEFCELEVQAQLNMVCSWQIVDYLAENRLLSKRIFDLIFNETNLDMFSKHNRRFYAVLSRLYSFFHEFLPFNYFIELALHVTKAEAIDGLMCYLRLRLKNLFTSEIKRAVAEEIEHGEAIFEIIKFFRKHKIFHPSCLPAVISAAKYKTKDTGMIDLIETLEMCFAYGIQDVDSLHQLLEIVIVSQGRVKCLVNFLRVPHYSSQENLLTRINIAQLPQLIPYIKSVHSAFAVLRYKKCFTQVIFDEIIQHPMNALFIAASCIGMESLRELSKDEYFVKNWPEAAISLRNFIDHATATRYFFGPVYRNQAGTSFTPPPPELLYMITKETIDPETIEKEVIEATLQHYLPK